MKHIAVTTVLAAASLLAHAPAAHAQGATPAPSSGAPAPGPAPAPAPTPAPPPAKITPKMKAEAKKHIQKATEAHQAGNFDVARTELETAYTLDPQPDLLYALGQVHVKLAQCREAVSYYERYLATNPGPEPTQATNEAITTCKQQLAAEEAAKAPPPPPIVESKPPPPPPSGKKFDVLGASLIGVGLVSSVVGVVMYTGARSDLDDSESAASYQESQSLVDDAHSKRTYAVVFGAIGVAAIGFGTWHFVKSRGEQRPATAGLTVAPSTSGGMITWRGSF